MNRSTVGLIVLVGLTVCVFSIYYVRVFEESKITIESPRLIGHGWRVRDDLKSYSAAKVVGLLGVQTAISPPSPPTAQVYKDSPSPPAYDRQIVFHTHQGMGHVIVHLKKDSVVFALEEYSDF